MTSFKQYMKESSDSINETLNRLIPSGETRPLQLHEAMRYATFSGGKRLRPIICLTTCEAVGGDREMAMTPAAAIEFLHTYTLIHDDLPCMDNDDTRRGRPSCHIQYDETTAVLAGDGLHALAFELIGACEAPPPYQPNQLIEELAKAVSSRGLVGGQMADLADYKTITLDDVQYVHATKTAALFRAAARIGAITGEADSDQLLAATEYGLHLGLAFQIVDDLLDSDQDNGDEKGVSYLQVASADEARNEAQSLINKAIASAGELIPEKNEPLIEIAQLVLSRTY